VAKAERRWFAPLLPLDGHSAADSDRSPDLGVLEEDEADALLGEQAPTVSRASFLLVAITSEGPRTDPHTRDGSHGAQGTDRPVDQLRSPSASEMKAIAWAIAALAAREGRSAFNITKSWSMPP
jgi:hypothetical protein